MLVAMPTAMPVVPLTSILGRRLGSTEGSSMESSKLARKSTVFWSMSASSSSAILASPGLGVAHGCRRVAVYAAEVALPINKGVAHGKTAGPCGPGYRTPTTRRGGETCPTPLRRYARISGAGSRGECPFRAWRRGCGAAPASARRAHRAGPRATMTLMA